MNKTDMKYKAYIQILEEELKPAMGCTEPISLAYAAAVAAKYMDGLPDKVLVEASGSIIKNVKSVIVPNTNHMKGIPVAAAVGIIAGNPDKELEVLADVTPEQIAKMQEFLQHTEITTKHIELGCTFDIIITLYQGEHYVKVRIANDHTNVVLIEKDGEKLKYIPVNGETNEGLTDRTLLNLADIYDFANTVDIEDLKHVLDPQHGHCRRRPAQQLRRQYRQRAFKNGRRKPGRTHPRTRYGSSRQRCPHERLRNAGCNLLRQRQPGHDHFHSCYCLRTGT